MVTVRRNDKIDRIIAGLRLAPQTRARMVRDVDRAFRTVETDLFESEGRSGSLRRWTALSPRYRVRKDRLFAGGAAFNQGLAKARTGRFLGRASMKKALGSENKILQLTGDMKRSFTMATDPDHVAQAEGGYERFKIVVGSTNLIAHYHYEGNPTLPIRRPIDLTEAQKSGLIAASREAYLDQARAVIRRELR